MFVSLSVSLSANISGTTRPNFTEFSVYVTHGRGLVRLWRHCDTLRTSGFVDNALFFCNRPTSHASSVAVTPLQRNTQANAPATWCWLLPVLDDVGRQDHSPKMFYELQAWNRQMDVSQHCLMPPYGRGHSKYKQHEMRPT